MTHFDLSQALGGGLLIGAAASVLWLALGKIAGVSGIAGGLPLARGYAFAWRALFLLGLIAGAALLYRLGVPAPHDRPQMPAWLLAGAGLLVGYGTAMGGGCTSGHGVCGVARRSPRSLVATAVFLGAGLFAASVLRHLPALLR